MLKEHKVQPLRAVLRRPGAPAERAVLHKQSDRLCRCAPEQSPSVAAAESHGPAEHTYHIAVLRQCRLRLPATSISLYTEPSSHKVDRIAVHTKSSDLNPKVALQRDKQNMVYVQVHLCMLWGEWLLLGLLGPLRR